MHKFTFICEFRKGSYITQYKSNNIYDALKIWSESLDLSLYHQKDLTEIRTMLDNYELTAISSVENVWCCVLFPRGSLLLLTIVDTR